ncbi:hypothetical protein MICRO8M_80269 [Microbacterium sp. 8M]|nr:hypothetical protein MICRO8M_80269 [Microbacterium sp. 8M]
MTRVCDRKSVCHDHRPVRRRISHHSHGTSGANGWSLGRAIAATCRHGITDAVPNDQRSPVEWINYAPEAVLLTHGRDTRLAPSSLSYGSGSQSPPHAEHVRHPSLVVRGWRDCPDFLCARTPRGRCLPRCPPSI